MESQSRLAKMDAQVAGELDRRLVDRLIGTGGRRRRGARVAVVVMATVVHLVALIFAVAGVALVVLGDNLVQRVIGVGVLLPSVALLLPRRSHETLERVDPTAAPAFTALVDQVCAELGTPRPTFIAISDEINATAARRGVRERRLVLGAPLWAALGPQGRVALLGHELGHFSNRDVVHGRYVWWALRTLDLWIALVTPDGLVSTEGRLPLFATIVTAPLRLPLVGTIVVMAKVSAAASRHDELRADTAAAVVAGTAGAVEMLETLLLGEVIDVAANRAAMDSTRPDLAVEIRARIDATAPDGRRTLPSSGEESSVDRTHPRTIDRLRLQESLPAVPARVVMDPGRQALVDAELRPLTDAALKRMADGYRYVW